jgi:prepilin-type N-terminal cleavage/methylation domain-containing protein
MLQQIRQPTSQAGFTLVELAIVMIIIGLLIAGVLKGQELIGNARVTSTVAQIKAIDAAVSTFKDTYQGMPGDLANASTRLPGCTAVPCDGSGNGDGQLDANAAPGSIPGVESTAFFPQLAVANLLTGLVPAAGATAWGGNFPAAKIDGAGFTAGTTATPSATLTGAGAVGAIGTNAGLFLALSSTPTIAATGDAVKPTAAGRIDSKLDDGVPAAGDVLGIGSTGSGVTNCASDATSTGVYNGTTNSATCGMFIHIQG